ncbi:ribosomal RNA large subunit methyltransferase [Skeletonema marinoi]|uniref:Ribosomal RNA large subunit methyltransferase n=1 Tax=Skeletonema marinoi TaxID=267567 RepID=A0AAD8Y884_9STRA|nr:ribosomal RNA large subunit methyltransferase [Skeletonema marinoi]
MKVQPRGHFNSQTKCSEMSFAPGTITVIGGPELHCSTEQLRDILLSHPDPKRPKWGVKIIHLVRNPFTMSVSNYNYHRQDPTPEPFVHWKNPCDAGEVGSNKDTLKDLAAPLLSQPKVKIRVRGQLPLVQPIMKREDFKNIEDDCSSLYQTKPGMENATFYEHLRTLDPTEGLRMATADKMNNIVLMAVDLIKFKRVRELVKASNPNHINGDMEVKTISMDDFIHQPGRSMYQVYDFVFNDLLSEETKITRSKTYEQSYLQQRESHHEMNNHITYGNSLHTVMVKRNRQSQNFREGAPLIFGNSIAATYSENGDDDSIPLGSLVAVYVSRDDAQKHTGKKYKKGKPSNEPVYAHTNYDSSEAAQHHATINNSQLIGYGVYNPQSMYRVRILCHATQHPVLAKESKRKQKQRVEDHDSEILKSILERKMSDAMNLRLAMNLPSESTDTYRLVNGEGDGCSGLAVDIIGGSTAIVMSSAAWCEVHKVAIVEVLEGLLNDHPSYNGVDIDIIWRNTPSRLKQDGYELSFESEASDEDDTEVIATESSVKYLTYPYSNGQKTGFYCDQRDNRLMVAERVTLLRVNGAAPCHTQSPASFPAGAYLTAALFHVGPVGS